MNVSWVLKFHRSVFACIIIERRTNLLNKKAVVVSSLCCPCSMTVSERVRGGLGEPEFCSWNMSKGDEKSFNSRN